MAMGNIFYEVIQVCIYGIWYWLDALFVGSDIVVFTTLSSISSFVMPQTTSATTTMPLLMPLLVRCWCTADTTTTAGAGADTKPTIDATNNDDTLFRCHKRNQYHHNATANAIRLHLLLNLPVHLHNCS